jgi:membrane-bound lytic murein transglycosylase A
MVHQTMNNNNSKAPSASSNNKIMIGQRWQGWDWARLGWTPIVGMLAACAAIPLPEPLPPAVPLTPPVAAPAVVPASVPGGVDPSPAPVMAPNSPAWQWADQQALPAPLRQGKSVWMPVRWSELPGWGADNLPLAWNAWLRSCEKPTPTTQGLCQEVRQLSIAGSGAQHEWMMRRLQPYRVQTPSGEASGLLTGYYEPTLQASRVQQGPYQTPLYALPAALPQGRPWFTRQQIATEPAALEALQDRAIAWLADPIDALLLQIQGSGRLLINEPDGGVRQVRLAYAGHNGQPYRSVARWLLERREIGSGTWEAIRAWAAGQPTAKVNEMLWSNPRTVFFREEPLSDFDAQFGPRGAQGVALTPGRSIAVDRESIPYGTPVWLHTPGPHAQLQRLVLAQDTGSAIVGAVRADYFTGWGEEAYTLAAGLKQPLQLWALWPRPSP